MDFIYPVIKIDIFLIYNNSCKLNMAHAIACKLCILKVRRLELEYELFKLKEEETRLEKIKLELIPVEEEAKLRAIFSYIGNHIPGSIIYMMLLYEKVDLSSYTSIDIYSSELVRITMKTSRSITKDKVEEGHEIRIKTQNKQIEHMVRSFFRIEKDSDSQAFVRCVWHQFPAGDKIIVKHFSP